MVLRREQFDTDLEDEMRLHRELRERERIESGLSPTEARRAARQQFGNDLELREECHDMWGWGWLETTLQDIRYGLRQLRRNPGFAAIAVLTLALGVGANTAIFSVVDGIVFRPLPYHDASRLVVIWSHRMTEANSRSPSSLPDFEDWQSQNSVFDRLAAFGISRYDIRGLEGGEGLRGALVTPEFFPLLGVKPFLGREVLPSDDRDRVVVLSYQLWQELYHGNRAVIGRTLRMSNNDYTVIGVMPPEFRNPPGVEMWLSFADFYALSGHAGVPNLITDRGFRGYIALGRLKRGVSPSQAQSQLDVIEQRLARSYPKDQGLDTLLIPMRDQIIGNVRTALLLLLGAVGFVLLIACANVANLTLARATVRKREMVIRTALGARRNRLIRQALTESLLLGAAGGGIGLLLAFGAVNIFLRIMPHTIPRLQDIRLDPPVLLFALATTVGATLLFGLTSAFRSARNELNDAIRESERAAGASVHARRLRSSLVSCEIALATALVIGSGLMLNSFIHLATLSPGFPSGHLLTFDVIAPLNRYRMPQQQTEFFDRVLAQIRLLPGVVAAGACVGMPPDIAQGQHTFNIQGLTSTEPGKSPQAWDLPATPGFLSALGLPLIRGRDFSDADTASAPPVAILNREIVRQYFGHGDPLGQEIEFRGVRRTIVGIVGDTTYRGLGSPSDFQIYIPYAQAPFPGLHFAVRTASQPLDEVAAIRSVVRSVDDEAAPARIFTMDQLLSTSIVQPRFYTWLLVAFGMTALALAATGVFGLVSYSVSQRTHEIGIRLALGAQRTEIVRMMVGEALTFAVLGEIAGGIIAIGLTHFFSTLLYDVKPTDPLTLAAVLLTLTIVVLLASYIPARRATQIEPIVALRYE
jgi:putative ABC transport system permease protein